MTVQTFTGTASRRKRKRVPTETGGGFTTIDDGVETATVLLAIDVPAVIALLGRRAMGSKSGTSKYLGGLIVAKVPKVRT